MKPASAAWSAKSPISAARWRAKWWPRGEVQRVEITPANIDGISGRPQVPRNPGRKEERNRPGHRPGLDRSGRPGAIHRSHADAGQGPPDADRQTRRRDAGVGAGGHELRPLAQPSVRPAEGFLPPSRHSRARSRGRHPEGRPVGRDHAFALRSSARSRASRSAAMWP